MRKKAFAYNNLIIYKKKYFFLKLGKKCMEFKMKHSTDSFTFYFGLYFHQITDHFDDNFGPFWLII